MRWSKIQNVFTRQQALSPGLKKAYRSCDQLKEASGQCSSVSTNARAQAQSRRREYMDPTGRSHQHKRGLWTEEEDRILTEYVELHGKGQWNRIAKKTGLKRCGKSCRLRWVNYLSPNVKRGNFTEEEEDLIIRLHKLIGNRWSLIAGRVPGRTDNQVKNYWNTHLSKRNGCTKRQRTESCTLNPEPKSAACSKDSDKMTTKTANTEQEQTAMDNTLTGNTLFSQNALDDVQTYTGSATWRDQLDQQMNCYKNLMQFSDEFLQFDFGWNNASSLLSD